MLKVEKINNNKARIILTHDELDKHKITPNDIKEGKAKAQNFFFKLLQDTNLTEDFEIESTQLLIEVTSENNLYIITITKADYIPDLKDYSKKHINCFSYTVSSSIFKFNTLENLLLFCDKVQKENLFVGKNSLYILNDVYFIVFTEKTVKQCEFVKTFSILSEYADKYYSKQLTKTSFKEHATLLIPNSSLQTLISI